MTEQSAQQQKVAEVIAAAMADPTFRQALVDDPESAVRERGIQLDQADLDRLQNMSTEERMEMAEALDTRQSAVHYSGSGGATGTATVDA